MSASKSLVHTISAGYVHDTGPIVIAELGKEIIREHAK